MPEIAGILDLPELLFTAICLYVKEFFPDYSRIDVGPGGIIYVVYGDDNIFILYDSLDDIYSMMKPKLNAQFLQFAALTTGEHKAMIIKNTNFVFKLGSKLYRTYQSSLIKHIYYKVNKQIFMATLQDGRLVDSKIQEVEVDKTKPLLEFKLSTTKDNQTIISWRTEPFIYDNVNVIVKGHYKYAKEVLDFTGISNNTGVIYVSQTPGELINVDTGEVTKPDRWYFDGLEPEIEVGMRTVLKNMPTCIPYKINALGNNRTCP